MIFTEKQKEDIMFMVKNDASVKEISEKLEISPPEIYEFLKVAIPNDKTIEFNKLRLSIQIRILVMYEKYDEVLELCNKEENLNNLNLQEQHVKILLKMYEKTEDNNVLERALVVCKKNPAIKDYKKLMNKIKRYMSGNNMLLTKLLSNIYYGSVCEDEIVESNITDWEKSLLLISYYEKNNRKKGLSYIKMLKKDYSNNKEKLKILNLLYERLNSKKMHVFDAILYSDYLNCTVNINLAKTKTIPKVEEIKIDSKPSVVAKVPDARKKSIYKPQQITTVKNCRYNRYNNPNSCNGSKIDNVTETIVKNKKIKDIFPREILVIGAYIYVEMNSINNQRRAIMAWDNFECLIEKSSNDTHAMGRIVAIIQKFKSAGILDSNVVVEEDKILKKKHK